MDDIDQKYKNFHNNIDEWIKGHNIDYGMDDSIELARRVGQIMHFTEEDIKKGIISFSSYDSLVLGKTPNDYLFH